MDIVTDRITEDEPCYGWQEVNRVWPMPDGSHQNRRMRFIFVVRGDAIAKYVEDIGPAADFTEESQLGILADGDAGDTVAQVRFMADASRDDTTYQRIRQEFRESSTLISDAINEAEMNRKAIQNQSVFGPGGHTQRNGVPGYMKGRLR